MTIIMVAKFEVLQTNTNFLLCSLGVADLVGGLLAPLEMVHLAHRNGPLYVPICLIEKVNLHFVLLTDTEEMGVLSVGDIPVAILPSCQSMKNIAS